MFQNIFVYEFDFNLQHSKEAYFPEIKDNIARLNLYNHSAHLARAVYRK